MLEGKLCIAILEEDNPLKSYFRVKPLLVRTEEGYEPFTAYESFPDDGCLRIVPDKNESGHFKARMRRMGRFCVLDLRAYPEANEKIRQNKNYNADGTERNSCIIYSDVVREPSEALVAEIHETAADIYPNTRYVLIGEESFSCTKSEGSDEAQLEPCLLPHEVIRFELEGFGGTLRFAASLCSPDDMLCAGESTVHRMIPVVPAKAAEPVQIPAVAEVPAQVTAPEAPVQPSEAREPAHTRERDPRTGLNPARGKGLQEIIDEKWCHSRMEQLGQPVPPLATGMPVEDPVDAAMRAVRTAWDNPALHDRLVREIAELSAFSTALEAHRSVMLNSAIRRELEDLESDRLQALDALEKLRHEKQALRETFKKEIREEEAALFAEAVKKTAAAKAEYEKYSALSNEAKAVVEEARDVAASLTDGRFEKKLREFMVVSRTAALLREPMATPAEEPPSDVTAETLIDRVLRCFEAEGLSMDRVRAADLLICAAIGEPILLSGSASCDKVAYARALSRALGLALREQEVTPPMPPVRFEKPNSPAAVLVRGANSTPRPVPMPHEALVLLEINDPGSGFAVDAETFTRSCLIRLKPEADAVWEARSIERTTYTPVNMSSLRAAMLVSGDVSPTARSRMAQLRSALRAHGVFLSRRTLDRVWSFCAAMSPYADGIAMLDRALVRFALGAILAEAPLKCLAEMKALLADMPECRAVLAASMPIRL